MFTYRTVKSANGLVLAERSDKKFVVFRVTQNGVESCMPSDMPRTGGAWFARHTPSGIAYVTTGYSRAYATRKFHAMSAR